MFRMRLSPRWTTRWITALLLMAGMGSLALCSLHEGTRQAEAGVALSADFGGYWFTGEAELSRYRLEQARYGATHEGHAVLIYVTEDFLPGPQVKSESGRPREKTGAIPILKLNFTKKFNTGIYPYSIMTSVFTPLDPGTPTLKTSTSVQEWCGHTYLQCNRRDRQHAVARELTLPPGNGDFHEVRAHSYFENEADQHLALDGALLEEGIWTQIRLDPEKLPVGVFQIIPGGEHSRLRHRVPQVLEARGSLSAPEKGTRRYVLEYPARRLVITFGAQAPHRIEEWEERVEGRGTTRATRTHTMRLDYWSRHAPGDVGLRQQLGL